MQEDDLLARVVAAKVGEDEQTSMEEDKPGKTCWEEQTWQLGQG